VVDDESDALLYLFEVLSAEGYFVEGSSSALDALGTLRRRPYDVVLSDARMPDLDGLELLDRIQGLRPRTRVILVGGAGDEVMKEAFLRRGAQGLLMKPLRREELLVVLRSALGAQDGTEVGLRQVSP
jgi:DNA-binding NtrC family response regulator